MRDEYIGMFSPKVGARITVHSYDETPFPEDKGVDASPGRETAIGIRRVRLPKSTLLSDRDFLFSSVTNNWNETSETRTYKMH